MPFAYEKLKGLDRDRFIATVDPVLRAYGLAGVEAIWRTDNRGWVLYLTVERPDSSEPGAGVTLDLCTDVSRDLSAALDVADLIEAPYRLEVGSPGVERKLYQREEYERFAGRLAKIKCQESIDGEYTFKGYLAGLDEQGRIVIDTENGMLNLAFEQIETGQLVLDMAAMGLGRGKPSGGSAVKGRKARAKTPKSETAGNQQAERKRDADAEFVGEDV